MSTGSDLGVGRKSYTLDFKGRTVDMTTVGTPMFTAQGKYIPLDDVDQIEGIAAQDHVGWEKVEVEAKLKQVDYDKIYDIVAEGQLEKIVDTGGRRALDGYQGVSNDMFNVAGRLILHPTGKPITDRNSDICLWLAAPNINLQYEGNRTKYQEVTVIFVGLPDRSRPKDGYPTSGAIFRLGDWTAVSRRPDFIGIVSTQRDAAPYKHEPAFSIDSDDVVKRYAAGFWYEEDDVTFDISDTGGISGTDAVVGYNNLSTDNYNLEGKYILCEAEIWYVKVQATASANTGTLDITRAAGYSAAASHADTTEATVCKNVYSFDVTDRCVWATSASADIDVNNTFGRGGELTWISAGTGVNITAALTDLLGTTTSKDHVGAAIA